MRLARSTDYSLRILMLLANARTTLVASGGLAAALMIPPEQMMKLVQRLARAGYVETVRGRGGGIRLSMPASGIRLGDVVRRLEGKTAVVDCTSPVCPLQGGCRLKRILDDAAAKFLATLETVTLADVADLPERMRRVV